MLSPDTTIIKKAIIFIDCDPKPSKLINLLISKAGTTACKLVVSLTCRGKLISPTRLLNFTNIAVIMTLFLTEHSSSTIS